jgi:hypothetical protein
VQWGKGHGLQVTFPAGYDVSNVFGATVGGAADGTATVAVDGQAVTVTRCGGSCSTIVHPGDGLILVTIQGVQNSGSSGSSGTFLLRQLDQGGIPVAVGDAPAVTLAGSNGGGNPPNDVDGDGVLNTHDNCPTIANPDQTDTDADGVGDACDVSNLSRRADFDQDGLANAADNCPRAFNPDQANLDHDRQGDACDRDDDHDGRVDSRDNCVGLYNPGQGDVDKDHIGDACDSDIDGDGILNGVDPCPRVVGTCAPGDYSPQLDRDQDGVPNAVDNCRSTPNADQANFDNDRQGDACDRDDDNDKVLDANDLDSATPLPGFPGWV